MTHSYKLRLDEIGKIVREARAQHATDWDEICAQIEILCDTSRWLFGLNDVTTGHDERVARDGRRKALRVARSKALARAIIGE